MPGYALVMAGICETKTSLIQISELTARTGDHIRALQSVCGLLLKTWYSQGFSVVAAFFQKGVSFISSHSENVRGPSEKELAFTLFRAAAKYEERTRLRFGRSLS
jgi:hypothetical protein